MHTDIYEIIFMIGIVIFMIGVLIFMIGVTMRIHKIEDKDND